MPSACAQPMENSGITQRQSSALVSTITAQLAANAHTGSVQTDSIHQLIPYFAQLFSPAKFAISPLFEHYFYPVSTGPTITTTKEKEKKGI